MIIVNVTSYAKKKKKRIDTKLLLFFPDYYTYKIHAYYVFMLHRGHAKICPKRRIRRGVISVQTSC